MKNTEKNTQDIYVVLFNIVNYLLLLFITFLSSSKFAAYEQFTKFVV